MLLVDYEPLAYVTVAEAALPDLHTLSSGLFSRQVLPYPISLPFKECRRLFENLFVRFRFAHVGGKVGGVRVYLSEAHQTSIPNEFVSD